MEIGKLIDSAQAQANQLAIQEANIREQIEALKARLSPLEMHLMQVLRLKHQAIGAVDALMKLAQSQQDGEQKSQTKPHDGERHV